MASAALTCKAGAVTGPLRILCVCTHNQTRSVMMGALLQRHAAEPDRPVTVHTGGFGAAGKPPTAGAIQMLEQRGINATAHHSSPVTDAAIERADLILTAEQQHVVSISSQGERIFDRTYTLPEFVQRADDTPRHNELPLDELLIELALRRPRGMDYLNATIGEIDDPTGGPPWMWRQSADEIESLVLTACGYLR